MTSNFWELLDAEYLDGVMCEKESGAEFRIPDAWWLGTAPIGSDFRPLLVQARRPVAEMPDFFRHGVLPLVSDKAKAVFQSFNRVEAEYYPVDVVTSEGHLGAKNPYWYFRLLTRLDAIDRVASKIDYFPGTDRPKRVWELQLKEGALKGHHAFRLSKVESIFVSDELKKACEDERLHIGFAPAEQFRLGW